MGVEDLIEGGWGEIDKITADLTPKEQAVVDRAKAEDYDLDVSYLQCFSSPAGQIVLEDMKQKYIFVNSYDPGKVNPTEFGLFLEGHRNSVLTIMLRMERAKLGSPVAERTIEL